VPRDHRFTCEHGPNSMQPSIDLNIDRIERSLASPDGKEQKLSSATALFRTHLLSRVAGLPRGATIGDAAAEIAKAPHLFQNEGAYFVRYLSVPEFLPPNNKTNNLHRNIVTIIESSLVPLSNFINLTQQRLTNEKIDVLVNVHPHICFILSPLRGAATEVTGILNARQGVFSCLNHSAVRSYCAPFGLAACRAHAEEVFNRFARLNVDNDSLSVDVHAAEATIEGALDFCESNFTFLTNEFVRPFLNAARTALLTFITFSKGRLSANIIPKYSASGTLSKRYHLQSSEREVQISIPLLNEGPASALRVRAMIESYLDDIVVEKNELLLGNVFPGNFSAITKIMTICPIEEATFSIAVSWYDAGSAEPHTVEFNRVIKSQVGEVDWISLKLATPYTDGVAKGSAFVGRAEKVQSLAAKMLRSPMESFYVTGQKRVGKTSLTLAAAEFARTHERGVDLHMCYCLWGDIADEPRESLRLLGNAIAKIVLRTLPDKYQQPLIFNSSLAELIVLLRNASEVVPKCKCLIIIDEFDEFHQELYLHGVLAETFFANLRVRPETLSMIA
jgi:hypothetical protein